MQKLDKRDVIIQKVESMKKGGYKATAIKVELEANFDREYGEWGDEAECYSFIMEQLGDLGLARRGEAHTIGHDREYDTIWHVDGPLTYAEFYNDGSVDSEFTFTILIDNPENVFLIPKVIEAFKSLGNEIGNGIGTWKAGMHTAILSTPDGSYPQDDDDITPDQKKRFDNFSRSMTLLLPALYFLGSNCQTSRNLEYRQPRVTSEWMSIPGSGYYDNAKYAAIYYSGGALEYRLFETCYDNPDTILDNIVVIANTLRFWRKKYRPSGLAKIANEVTFGIRDGDSLLRFYQTEAHIDFLNAGLRKLKPAYYTVSQIKQQRDFKLNKREITTKLNKVRNLAKSQYSKYAARQKWEAKAYRRRVEAEFIDNYVYRNTNSLDTVNVEEALATILANAEKQVLENDRTKVMSVEEFVANEVRNNQPNIGKWVLKEEPPVEEPPAPRRTAREVVADMANMAPGRVVWATEVQQAMTQSFAPESFVTLDEMSASCPCGDPTCGENA